MPNLTILRRAKVRKQVQDALLRVYWDSITEALSAVNDAFEQHNMFLDYDNVSFAGDDGRATLLIRADKGYTAVCNACTEDVAYPSFDNCFAVSWYKMPSGKFEVTGYIS
jgi:hypothetical protein